jgi:hypothetical protein
MLLSLFVNADITAEPEQEKFYVRIAHSLSQDDSDLTNTSIGAVALENNMIGYADLTYLDSDKNGKALALEFGAGLAYDWHLSPYLAIGASLGYNWDKEEYIAAYFPEVGMIVNFTRAFGMSLSAKRYYSLYEEDEDVVMLGLVIRN